MIYIDYNNYVMGSTPPDRLRGDQGTYPDSQHRSHPTGSLFKKFSTGKLQMMNVRSTTHNNNQLYPTIVHKIELYGNPNSFHDHAQWRQFIEETIVQDFDYEDNMFECLIVDKSCVLHIGQNRPNYENLSKTIDTNLMLNYNVVKYPHERTTLIKDLSTMRSSFEPEPTVVNDTINKGTATNHYNELFENYARRLNNTAVSRTEIVNRNRNIFILNDDHLMKNLPINNVTDHFPCLLDCNVSTLNAGDKTISNIFEQTNFLKKIFQACKNNIAAGFADMYSTAENKKIMIKKHDLSDLLYEMDFKNFVIDQRELFLLREGDSINPVKNRFVNQISMIKIAEKIHASIKAFGKNYLQIINSEPSKTFDIGYKVEKFHLSDSGVPVQTYYIQNTDFKNFNFRDSQLKFGSKYIYKIYKMVLVLGASYRYSDVAISNSEGSHEFLDGGVPIPQGTYEPLVSDTEPYSAMATIEVSPNLSIVELPVYEFEKVFFDRMPPPVSVNFHRSNAGLHISMVPMVYPRGLPTFFPLSSAERGIQDNLLLSAGNTPVRDNRYFKGKYLIYRMMTKPKSLSEFADHFLTEIDQKTTFTLIEDGKVSTTQREVDILTANFIDKIHTNRKYYYLIRSATYHYTPSNPDTVYEIEIVKSGMNNELKVNIIEMDYEDKLDW